MTGAVSWLALSASAAATLKVAIALAGAALAAFELVLVRAGRADERSALRRRLWIALAVLAVLAWARPGPLGGPRGIHVWEFHHHVLGAKYFAELGYTRLYDCTLLADTEDGFEFAAADRPIRRLGTNRVESGDAVVADADGACMRHFDEARWREFRGDVALFRNAVAPRLWALMLTDHGFNASPVWTIFGAALARAAPLSEGQLRRLTWLDPLLLAGMSAALAWGFGLRVTALVWIALGTSYLSDHRWIGNAFLRYDWLALCGIGLAAMRRDRLVLAGFALTWATGVRVFPGFLVAAVVLHAAIDLARRRSLVLSPAHRRFALGCVLAIATLGPLSIAVAGTDAWAGFVANSRKHLATPLTNFVGWKTVVRFDPATSSGALLDAALPDPYAPWHVAARENFERREPLFAAGVVVFGVLLVAALRRTPLAWAAGLGIGLVIFAAEIGAYYYALLALYAGIAERIPLAGVLLLLAAAASHGIADAIGGSADVVFTALSALAMLLAVCATALSLRSRDCVETPHGPDADPRE